MKISDKLKQKIKDMNITPEEVMNDMDVILKLFEKVNKMDLEKENLEELTKNSQELLEQLSKNIQKIWIPKNKLLLIGYV